MQEILRNAALRRMFFIGTLTLLVLLVVFRLCVIGDPGSDPVWNACASVTQSLFCDHLHHDIARRLSFLHNPAYD
jgi:hypothetical protein